MSAGSDRPDGDTPVGSGDGSPSPPRSTPAASRGEGASLRDGALAERCVSVLVAGSVFGLPIGNVQEIIGPRPLTRIFRAPAAVAGVTSLRGDILPVLDLGCLLDLSGEALDADRWRIVVVRGSGDAARRAGLKVGGLGPVRDVPRGFDALDPVPSSVAARTRAYVRGVLLEPPLCAVLDVEALLDAPELGPLAGRSEGA